MTSCMRRCGHRIVAVVCAVLGTCAVAHAQSAVDGFDPGANGQVNTLAVQADGKILVGGGFTTLGGGGFGTTTRNRIGRLNADGSVDTGFNPGANGIVNVLVVQPDGKILVGGAFSALGGGVGTTTRNRIGRLNANGSVDTSFDPGATDQVNAVVVQAGGKILVGGWFTMLGGGGTGTTPRNRLGRINADGSLDLDFNPGANDVVVALTVQPDGKILVGGFFSGLGNGSGSTSRNYIGRLNADGSLDTIFNPGANSFVNALAAQPDGKILVGGFFTGLGGGIGTTTRNRIGRLHADGSVDASFNPGVNSTVNTLVVQPDGKILAGGFFTGLGGGTGTTTRNRIGRLYASGSLDTNFNPGANGSLPRVHVIALQPDGKILVGGQFTTLGGVARNHIGRLNADGSLDAAFNPGANGGVDTVAVQPDGRILVGGFFTTLGGATHQNIGRLNADGSADATFNPIADFSVTTLAVQLDGKILVAGDFTHLGGVTRNHIGRLEANSSLDTSFDPGANSFVSTLAVQPDGKILVGGGFTVLGGGTRNYLGRLNTNGSLDTSFDPGANFNVNIVAVQPDGKILVGGAFSMLGGGGTGMPREFFGRLNANGSLDTLFDPGANGGIETLAVQTDGKILLGGSFTTLGGGGSGIFVRNYIGRLNPDGSLDDSFIPGVSGDSLLGPVAVYALAVQPDGKILVGGQFSGLGGGTGTTPRNCIGRLTNTDAAIQRLRVTGGGRLVTWSRSGAAPEVERVTFESSTDGATYTLLKSGTRVAGGWELTGPHLATGQNLYMRARGYYATGDSEGSGSIVESVRTVYVTYQPFADDVLTVGTSLIRAVHITDLRARIDALRVRFGLVAFPWTDASLTVGMTVMAVYVTELRTALQGAYTAASQPAPIFTNATLVPGSTVIRAVHIEELRGAVIDLEGS